MANYKAVDTNQLEADLTEIADAIREKTEDTEKLSMAAMAQTIRAMPDLIVNTAIGSAIALTDSTDLKLRGLRLFGRTTQDGTPSPEAPVELVSAGDEGSVGVTVAGKNLFNPALLSQEPGYNTFDETTGLWTTNTGKSYFRSFLYNVAGNSGKRDVTKIISVPPNTQMTCLLHDLSFSEDCTDKSISVSFYTENGEYIRNYLLVNQGKAHSTFTTPEQCHYIDIRRAYAAGTISFSTIQLEIGSTATAYESYKEPQTITASTPFGLPGIPVTSGGNYTDENGQQWVCDEVDLAVGVGIQRVGKLDSYNGESVGNIYLSSTGALTTGATVLYLLTQSIETSLTAEELAAYALLHTNYPNTTILNDSGAGMEVKYVADIKLYIDQKFDQLAEALVDNV